MQEESNFVDDRNQEAVNSPSRRATRPLATTLATAAGLVRLIPHPWNFTPCGAVELFAGARLKTWHAFAIPLAVRIVTDVALLPIQGLVADNLWYYASFLPFVYLSIVINVLIGRTLSRTESPFWIALATLAASVQFYLVTNFGAWIGSSMYPHTLGGLATAYLMGLKTYGDSIFSNFAIATLVGNFGFVAVLFGMHALLSRTEFPQERVVATAD